MRKLWLIAGVALLGAVVGLAFVQQQDTSRGEQAAGAEATGAVQPIQFPHDIHAGQYQMDCMYCHFSAERSVDAGIPTVESCMGCHRGLVPGTANPEEIEKLRGYAQRQEPIPWVRIYKVADHVHFPHMRHVTSAGIACQTCHGQVQEMGPIEERAPEWGGADMGWCVSCHVERGASRDCTVCHY